MSNKTFSRRAFIRTSLVAANLTTALGLGLAGYAYRVEPEWLDLSAVTVPIAGLDPAFAGYRIAHLTDLHVDPTWMTPPRLRSIVELANDQQADLIAITGDFITSHSQQYAKTTAEALAGLNARDGVVAVLGNHDHWWYPEVIRHVLSLVGIRNLGDSFMTIRRGAASLQIAGLDDLWPDPTRRFTIYDHEPRFRQLLATLPAEGAAVLLVHEPDFADISAASGRFGLQLSGHSHGGQVRLPGRGPLILPDMGRKYPAGLYQLGGMTQFTSRGLGLVPPQVRFNCRPELAVLTLQPA
ncbi:MAG TPA: metallophosphoesterase [Herpetosiphonaceae bacterium]